MPKTGLNAETLKDEAITISLDLIRKYGYEKFRLLDVAKSLGISHAALYKYFHSKETLLDSVNARWLEEIDGALQLIVEGYLSPSSKFNAWALRLHEMKRAKVLSDLEPYEAFLEATYTNRPYIQAHLDVQDKQIKSMLTEMKNAGLLHVDIETAVKILYAVLLSFHHPYFVKQYAEQDRTSELQILLETTFKGL